MHYSEANGKRLCEVLPLITRRMLRFAPVEFDIYRTVLKISK